MYQINKIPDNDGKGFTITIAGENVEGVNAIEYYKNIQIAKKEVLYREMLFLINDRPYTMEELEQVIQKRAHEDWEELYKVIMAEKVPPMLFSTLKADNKKYQVKFLRGIQFTPLQLVAFFFTACRDLGYTLSIYSSEHLPVGTNEEAMPALARVEGDSVTTAGETSMKEGEIKQAVTQRSATYGKILDKEDEWHCFFITIESAAGKENWKNGQPHYHYISDKFGIPRDYVVQQLMSKDYDLSGLPHLELHGYRDK